MYHHSDFHHRHVTASRFTQTFALGAGIIVTVGLGLLHLTLDAVPDGSVASLIDISAQVVDCNISFVVHPEKRIPATGNWAEVIDIQTIDPITSNVLTSETLSLDNQGQTQSPTCPYTFYVEGKNYNVVVKGTSHLRKLFTDQPLVGFPVTIVDLTTGGRVLLAGDTDEPVGDNDIDYDDVTSLTLQLYTNNVRNDLNRDGEVNSLDLSNMMTNLGLSGD